MDVDRFDLLSRSLVTASSRRAVSRAITALGLAGGISALFNAADAEAKKKRKKKKKRCKPKSTATTCAGKCGTVTNNCKKPVDCGADCNFGYVCLDGTCKSCGFDDEPCCDGNSCELGDLFCNAGTCQYCGSLREPCCPGNICVIGSCVAGQCQA